MRTPRRQRKDPTLITNSQICVTIPAWQPDRRLNELVSQVLESGFGSVIIINDGSDPSRDQLFEELKQPRVHVLRHAVNLGKGRALKTGLNYFLNEFSDYLGIVTADADGQHSVKDIVAVAERLGVECGRLVIGSRRFRGAIPFRSRFGNTVTRYLFAILTGRNLSDTQSGLRGIPLRLIPTFLALDGEHYEYEMNVLTTAAHSFGIEEVPIETIYLEGNRSSHFNPVLDSMRIYFVLLRFMASSLIAAGIDFVVFAIVFWATSNVLTSMIAGRVSSLANFALNRRFVFNSGGNVAASLAKYYAVVAAIGVTAYYCVTFLSEAGVNVLLAKAATETGLWFVSFAIQRTFVFGVKPESGRS